MEGRDPQRTSRSPERGPASARLRWSVSVPVGPSVPAVGADGTAYLGAADGRLVAYDPAGQTVWSVPIGRGPLSSPAVGPDGTVYVRTADGSLHARKPDGAPRWTTDIAAAPAETPHAPVVGPDRYLAMASYQSSLLMFVQPGGFFEYGFNVKARTLAGPALGVDRTLYGGAEDGTFWAISPEAIPRWTYQADGPVTSAPAVDPERGVYFLVGGGQPGLVALDRRGKLRWRAPACWSAAPRPLWPAVAANGTVVVGNCALGPDGSPRWRLDLGPTWATPAALDAAGTAYLGTGDGRLLALAPDGAVRWSLDLGGRPAGPPVLAGPGAIILTAGSALDAVGE
jgi:outer membrane protein assembly factor BamB